MSSIPIALWNLKVPSGGAKIPGYDDEEGSPLPYRITMAAIDSSTPSSKPSTLKLHKRIVTVVDEDDEDEDSGMDDKKVPRKNLLFALWKPERYTVLLPLC